jgi:choline dehydrogenase-like flavoprotein
MSKAIVVGSGAGGSVVSMVLAEAGWDVVLFEMGPQYYTNLAGQGPFPTVFSNDELKSMRYFEDPDPLAFPRTFRQNANQNAAATYVGDVNNGASGFCVGPVLGLTGVRQDLPYA